MDVQHVNLVVLLTLWGRLLAVDYERQRNYDEQQDRGVVKGHKGHELVGAR